MQLSVGTVLVSLPAAFSLGQMLIDNSLDAMPQLIGWSAAVVIYQVVTSPGNVRGLLDWTAHQTALGPDMRRRLGIPDELPQVAPPPRSKGAWRFLDGLSADVRNVQAAIAARRGDVIEGSFTLEDSPPPAQSAGVVTAPRRPVEDGDGAAVDAIDADEAPAAAVPNIGLPVVTIESIADLDNIWVVGQKGSGKTTVLRRLLELRRGKHIAIDPHTTPGKWTGCAVVGGGRDFSAIDLEIDRHVGTMDKRYKAMATGEITEADCQKRRVTIVGDEWLSISENLPEIKPSRSDTGRKSAADRLATILTEGRKAGICILAAAHADTATAMGLSGKKDLLKSFDRVVYLGAMATERVPESARMARPAVVYDPEHRQWYQLIVSVPKAQGAASAAPAPPAPATEALPGLIPCDRCGEPTPRAGRHCIVCGAPQHSAGDVTAPLVHRQQAQAATPERQREARAAAPEDDTLFAALLAQSAPVPPPAPAPDIYAHLSPKYAERLRAIQARQQSATTAPAPEPRTTEDAPPPASGQSVTVDQPGGGHVIVNVSQVAPAAGKAQRRRGRGVNTKRMKAKADRYHQIKAMVAEGKSANKIDQALPGVRAEKLKLVRQAKDELGGANR
jgi:hypothetical protein